MYTLSVILISLCALGVNLSPASNGGPDLNIVVTSRFDDTGSAFSTAGKVKIEVRELRVETEGPYGKHVANRILVLFDPKSGAFSWNAFGEDSPATNISRQAKALENERAVFLKGDSLVTFSGGNAPALYVHEYRDHASNLDEAEAKALSAAAKLNNPPGNLDLAQPRRVVRLQSLGREFVAPPMSEQVGQTPKVTDVQWGDNQWVVTLQGQWTEAVTLGADYNVLSMRKIE